MSCTDLRAAPPPTPLEFTHWLARVDRSLHALCGTSGPLFVAPGDSFMALEAALRCTVRQRVLVGVGGTRGQRLAAAAERLGLQVIRAEVHPGTALEPDWLARFLEGPEADTVVLVQDEPSTGVLAPLEPLARVVRTRKDLILLVDAGWSLGANPLELDQWGLDVVIGETGPGLRMPAGLTIGAASQRWMERARRTRHRGLGLDLLAWFESTSAGQPVGSLPWPQCEMLADRLKPIGPDSGVRSWWQRHYDRLLVLERWAASHPSVRFVAAEGSRSHAASCLRLPDGLTSREVVDRLGKAGSLVDQGLGELEAGTIRVAHAPDVPDEEFERVLNALAAMLP